MECSLMKCVKTGKTLLISTEESTEILEHLAWYFYVLL